MKIERLRIQRFRSIKKADIALGRTTAIVGANNAGKSAILRAMNAFFHPEEERQFFNDGSHAYSKRSMARIEIAFTDLPRAGIITSNSDANTLTLRATWAARSEMPKYDIYKAGVYEAVGTNLLAAIRSYLNFVLIPPHRDPSRFREEEQALLRQVADRYLNHATQKRDTISTKFRDAAQYLETHQFEAISRELTALYASPDDVQFRITLGNALTYRDFIRRVDIKFSEGEIEFGLENCGTGIQSQAIITLHRLLARLEKRKIVIGIEEPETNLHPQAQQRFVSTLAESIMSDSQEIQCVLTTHSTVVVDSLSHEDIVLVKKVSDPNRGFRTEVVKLEPGFWSRNGLDELQYQKFHQYRNSEFLFSNLVLAVESTTDADVFRHLLLRDGINLAREGVSVLNLDGGRNLAYAIHLLKELEIPFVLVLDKDHFLPYQLDKRSDSLDTDGWPIYRQEYKTNSMIEDLVPNAVVRKALLPALKSNHTQALDHLEPFGVVCMRYSLEVDLVASTGARNTMFDIQKLQGVNRTEKKLLVDRYKAIKKTALLIEVIDQVPLRSLPRSFSRIKKLVNHHLNPDEVS